MNFDLIFSNLDCYLKVFTLICQYIKAAVITMHYCYYVQIPQQAELNTGTIPSLKRLAAYQLITLPLMVTNIPRVLIYVSKTSQMATGNITPSLFSLWSWRVHSKSLATRTISIVYVSD